MVLLLKLKDPALHDNKFRIEVTKIEYAVPHPVNLVEKQLKADGKKLGEADLTELDAIWNRVKDL